MDGKLLARSDMKIYGKITILIFVLLAIAILIIAIINFSSKKNDQILYELSTEDNLTKRKLMYRRLESKIITDQDIIVCFDKLESHKDKAILLNYAISEKKVSSFIILSSINLGEMSKFQIDELLLFMETGKQINQIEESNSTSLKDWLDKKSYEKFIESTYMKTYTR